FRDNPLNVLPHPIPVEPDPPADMTTTGVDVLEKRFPGQPTMIADWVGLVNSMYDSANRQINAPPNPQHIPACRTKRTLVGMNHR
ncbi:hypothetical protein, partial [Nonomuraea sp. bgisy101]|uniref:hypothetical protein n=1 Tax=Nonomuraea sp. bgisy101 TaxID=3413784 RepID=UPI003D7206BF